MALLKHERRDAAEGTWDWPIALLPPWRWLEGTAGVTGQLIKVEEFTEDGTLVVRAELPGIDPEKDVEITVNDSTLFIRAERHEEEEKTERNFHRKELRYGSFFRAVGMPEGTDASAVAATYKDGMLEVRVPLPADAPKAETQRVPVARS